MRRMCGCVVTIILLLLILCGCEKAPRLKYAVQLYSVREDFEADMEGTLQKISEMGYQGVEFAGLFGKDPEYVHALCDKYHLVPVSAHVTLEELLDNPDETIQTYKMIGCKHLVIAFLPQEYRPEKNNLDELCSKLIGLGKKCRQNGMTLGYHNHDFEFEKENGKCFLEELFDSIPEDDLEMELDTCWADITGVDIQKLLNDYKNRQSIIHLKDYVGEYGNNMYNLIGLKSEKNNGENSMEFRPLGEGVLDIQSVLEAAHEVGIEWLIVEQDECSMGLTPISSVKKSIQYLKEYNNEKR